MAPAKEMLDALNLQSDMQLDSSKPIHTYLNSLPVLLTQVLCTDIGPKVLPRTELGKCIRCIYALFIDSNQNNTKTS